METKDQEQKFDYSVYSIRDSKVGKFNTPFLAQNNDDAKRIFYDLVTASGDSMLAKHPEDFDLYFVCQFDSVAGVMSIDLPVHLMSASVVYDTYKEKFRNSLTSSIKAETESSVA